MFYLLNSELNKPPGWKLTLYKIGVAFYGLVIMMLGFKVTDYIHLGSSMNATWFANYIKIFAVAGIAGSLHVIYHGIRYRLKSETFGLLLTGEVLMNLAILAVCVSILFPGFAKLLFAS